jgi:hypothetical protein
MLQFNQKEAHHARLRPIHQQDSLYAHEVDHLIPPSAEGRVTVFVLKLNDEIRIRVRQALIEAGHYPRP